MDNIEDATLALTLGANVNVLDRLMVSTLIKYLYCCLLDLLFKALYSITKEISHGGFKRFSN